MIKIMTAGDLTKDRLKILIIEYLRQDPDTQFSNILQFGIADKIGRHLNSLEERLVIELLHELTVSNILMPGKSRGALGWPWLSLTTHGREVLRKSGPPIYDYDGYLAELKNRVNSLDQVVEHYLSESLRAYQFNLYFAAMVMLGCSSERAINLLIDAYVNSIEDDTNQEKLRSRISGRDISVAYERFKQSFDTTKNQINNETLMHDFDSHVDGIFTFIRLLRNSIVHPTAVPTITNALVYSNLQQYSYYVITVFELIHYYQKHKTKV